MGPDSVTWIGQQKSSCESDIFRRENPFYGFYVKDHGELIPDDILRQIAATEAGKGPLLYINDDASMRKEDSLAHRESANEVNDELESDSKNPAAAV